MTEQQKIGLVLVQKKPNRLQKYVNRGAVALTAATTGSLTMAAYDVTDILTNLGLAVTAAATIGVAWLGFTAGIAIWRNLRAAAK
ncbi:major capsid protein [Acinetobacter junii]|uniref:major capsid protein n=1 Tax=Acinetobacter junii TaxID=40215 RepID=UPI002DBC8CC5|nr:major capsid protein [Acinetobacter junii]MEB8381102.1 major capsid protein [Acinetobacter junii]MEB8381115.1 major capsid protein [Acinetobacter junii]